MKRKFLLMAIGVCLANFLFGQTYTGQFYAPNTNGMYADPWFNLKPQSGVNSANNWNIHHQDNSSLFQVWFAATQPSIQVGTGRTTNFYVNGNVGIGTTTPRGQFDVAGLGDIYLANNTTVGAAQNAFFPGHIYVAPHAGSDWSYFQARRSDNSGSTNFRFRTYNAGSLTEAMSILSNGNVGVGTIIPQSKLDVNGDIQISNASVPMGLMTEVGGVTPLLNMSVNFREPNKNTTYIGAAFRIDTRSDHPLFQWLSRPAGGVESVLMSLNQSGNVGIGTTTPGSYKLAVEGKIGAREVNVIATNPWPDYVFEKNYKLPSLEEIKNYIDQNQHLPEVPSAKEVEKNGVNLGEMNSVLLKKIEELTLYMIEANKKMESQLAKLEDATTKIENQQQQIEELKQAVKKN